MKTGESGEGAGARRSLYVLMALAGIGVAALTVFSNHYDWDAFYALAEVDYRSWWVDHELPLWSYQMCAGTSRIADPQAFGLSPLFVLVRVFGSFWGTKLLVLLSLGLGVFFTARILELAHCHGSDQLPKRRLYLTLALLFVFGNYFMWHLMVGHVTFSVMLLALGIAYFTLKGYLDGLSRGELACGTLLAWQHYSSAFYHSSIYFLAPFFIAFALFVVADFVRDRGSSGPGSVRRAALKVRHALGFNVAGVVLGSYKIWAAWSYSRGIGRRHGVLHETLEPMQVGSHLLIPTWDRHFLIDFDPGNIWDVHEYSAFSLIVPLALGVAVWALARRRDWTGFSGISSIGLFAGTYLFIAGCFSLGDFSPFSPYGLINRLLLGSEARIIGRFHIGIILALAMILMVLLRAPHRRRWIGDLTCSVLLGGLLLNLSGFLTLANAHQLGEILAYPAEPSARMQSWRWAKVFLPEAGVMGKELAPDNT
nr:hypothetical protein [Myxococcota bacterium]